MPEISADMANAGEPETLVRKTMDERPVLLEDVLEDHMTGIETLMAELATLSLLEESFARICNVIRRLDQEVQTMRSTAANRR